MVRSGLLNDALEKAYTDELLKKYRGGEIDLPNLTLILLDIPSMNAGEFLQRSIPHNERWQAFQKIKENTSLPKDGIWRLQDLYFGCLSQV